MIIAYDDHVKSATFTNSMSDAVTAGNIFGAANLANAGIQNGLGANVETGVGTDNVVNIEWSSTVDINVLFFAGFGGQSDLTELEIKIFDGLTEVWASGTQTASKNAWYFETAKTGDKIELTFTDPSPGGLGTSIYPGMLLNRLFASESISLCWMPDYTVSGGAAPMRRSYAMGQGRVDQAVNKAVRSFDTSHDRHLTEDEASALRKAFSYCGNARDIVVLPKDGDGDAIIGGLTAAQLTSGGGKRWSAGFTVREWY